MALIDPEEASLHLRRLGSAHGAGRDTSTLPPDKGVKMEELLTEKELAALLKCHPATLRTARCKGVGAPYIKIGASVRYRASEVEAWLDSQRVSG